MKNRSSHYKKLNQILTSEDFLRLDEYKNSQQWKNMSSKERELLANLFIKKGKKQLLEENSQATESFHLAMTILPDNPSLLHQIGLSYASQDHKISCLNLACKFFKHASEISPDFFQAFVNWGSVLINLGILHDDTNYFQDALQKFSYASTLLPKINDHLAIFYWHWGKCWHLLGKQSGEPRDFFHALEKYQHVPQEDSQLPDFWTDYGDLFSEIGILLERNDLFFQAIECYQKALNNNPNHYFSLFCLGCTYSYLYDKYAQEEDFQKAQNAFQNASQLEPKDVNLWAKWGILIFNRNKYEKNISGYQECCEKFKLGYANDPNNPWLLMHWADALLFAGIQNERIDLLLAAEEKLIKASHLISENSEVWYTLGICFNEIGRYYGDVRFYQKAIEKFQHGLSIDESHYFFWYGLAISHFAIGELQDDSEMIEKSIYLCSRALEFGGEKVIPQLWNDWGVALLKLGEMTDNVKAVELALEKFEEAITRQTKQSGANFIELEWLYNYGCALDFMGDLTEDESYYEKAIQVLTRVVQSEPDNVHGRYHFALALSHLGEAEGDVELLQKAIEHFHSLITQDPEDDMAWNDCGLSLLNLGLLIYDPAYSEQSYRIFEEAEESFIHAISLGYTSSYYNLACLHSLKGDYQAALYYAERAENSGALPTLDDMMNDDWLEGFRETDLFKNFISQISNKHNKSQEMS